MAAQIPIVATTSTPGIVRNSKKRPASPSHNGSSGGGYGASKKKKVSASGFAQGISMEAMNENKVVPSEFSTGPVEKAAKPLPFKDPNFVHSGHGGAVAGKKNRTWKNLKQILASERALPWQLNDPNCELARAFHVFTVFRTSVLMLLHPLSQLRSILMFQVCLPTTQTPRANCGSAPLKSFPIFGGCPLTSSPATWP
nr:INO80 complex subunit C isoform X1 [Chlorocebus sabaeus]